MTDSNSIQKSLINIPCVSNDGAGPLIFTTRKVALSGLSDRVLSEQIQAINFRLRASDQYYACERHVAGDPTLLIVLSGAIRIELRSGEFQEFSNEQMFIYQDYLQSDTQ
ncbi:MAG: hypothetical protein ACI9WC_001756 [Arenicella sp.]|jgi:hypothetical protein